MTPPRVAGGERRPPVDFDELRARLAGTGAATVDPRAVLEARARALARPAAASQSAAAAAGSLQLLVLRRGDATFAVPVDHVLDVARITALTRLPGADAPVFGVLPWRGRLLTVVDLAQSAAPITRVVVVQSGAAAIGVAADVVDDVRTFDAAAIHASTDDGVVRGTTDDAISLLDPAALVRRVGPAR